MGELGRGGVGGVGGIKADGHGVIGEALKANDSEPAFSCLDASQITATSNQVSSHEVGLLETVTLLESLQLLPKQLVIFGVSNGKNIFIEKIINMF